ncbi:MAG TPA: hypothetical protein VGG57_10500 [Stellaceae bacterium]
MPRVLCASLFCAMLAAVAVTWARPPDNADPALHGWFESLRQPGTGVPCCSVADCRPTDYRLATDGYEVFLDNKWVRVPAQRIVHVANPVGRAIVCRTTVSDAILCFVPASET